MQFDTATISLSLRRVENIIIMPNIKNFGNENNCGLFHCDLRPHLESKTSRFPHPSQEIQYQNNFPNLCSGYLENIQKIDSCVFLGSLPDHYGHFITEGLSRFWWLLEEDEVAIRKVYCAPKRFKYHEFISQTFGSDIECISQPVFVKECLVPDASIILQNYVNRKYWDTVDYITKKCDLAHPDQKYSEKIYLSKLEVKNGRNIGEKILIKFFREQNINIVDPMNYSLDLFIAILRKSKLVVASSGSQAHNAVFLRDNQTLIEIQRSEHVHPFQEYIANYRKHKRISLRGYFIKSSGDFSNGPFSLYPTDQIRLYFSGKSKPVLKLFFLVHFYVVSTVMKCRVTLLRWKYKSLI